MKASQASSIIIPNLSIICLIDSDRESRLTSVKWFHGSRTSSDRQPPAEIEEEIEYEEEVTTTTTEATTTVTTTTSTTTTR